MHRGNVIRELHATVSLLGFLWIGLLVVTILSVLTHSTPHSVPTAVLLTLIAICEVLLVTVLLRLGRSGPSALVFMASHSAASVALAIAVVADVGVTIYEFCMCLFWTLAVISYLLLCYELKQTLPPMSVKMTAVGIIVTAVGLIGMSVGALVWTLVFLLGLLIFGVGMALNISPVLKR